MHVGATLDPLLLPFECECQLNEVNRVKKKVRTRYLDIIIRGCNVTGGGNRIDDAAVMGKVANNAGKEPGTGDVITDAGSEPVFGNANGDRIGDAGLEPVFGDVISNAGAEPGRNWGHDRRRGLGACNGGRDQRCGYEACNGGRDRKASPAATQLQQHRPLRGGVADICKL